MWSVLRVGHTIHDELYLFTVNAYTIFYSSGHEAGK